MDLGTAPSRVVRLLDISFDGIGEMKSLVFVADLHLHPFRLCSRDGGRDRLNDGLQALDQSLGYAREIQALWIFLGDAKQPRILWHQEALNGALEIFRKYGDVTKLFLPGNHDGPRLPGGSGLQPFASLERSKLCELPTLLPAWGPGLAVWPCEADEDGLDVFVRQAGANGCPVLLSHGLLSGCKLSPDIAGTGLTPERFGIGRADPAFSLSIFGDVHRGQIFRQYRHQWAWETFDNMLQEPTFGKEMPIWKGQFSGQIVYPGDPYQQNWGEAKEWPKGILVVRPDLNEISLYPIKSPRFISMDWTDRTEDEFIRFIHGKFSPEGIQVIDWENNFVRVILPPWGDNRAIHSALTLLKIPRRSFQVIVEPAPRVETRSNIHAGLGGNDLLTQYMEAKPPEDGLDKKSVLTAGMRLWGEQDG